MAGHNFHPSLLRAYDIRGIVGDTLTEADATAVGRSFGTMLRRAGGRPGNPRVCLGRDGRVSSRSLANALAVEAAAPEQLEGTQQQTLMWRATVEMVLY